MSQGPDKVIHFYPTNLHSTMFFQKMYWTNQCIMEKTSNKIATIDFEALATTDFEDMDVN